MKLRKLLSGVFPKKEEPVQKTETKTSPLNKETEGEAFTQDALNYYAPYTGVPAPAYLEDDPWFGPAPIKSEKQLDYMEQETLVKQQQHQETHSVEPENIHEMMYKIASKNWNTVSETQGGSENFQEGPGGWNSGTGMGQFL
tara:strand:+ start:591 stop:1016 length:426 start_codon:yes stop_codon:yes gene_type:complete